MNIILFRILGFASLLSTSGVALAQSTCPIQTPYGQAHPRNELIGKQESSNRRYLIHDSVPTECRRPVYDAAIAWSNTTAKNVFTWAGYTANYSHGTDINDRNISTTENTIDTQTEVGFPDDYTAWGETHFRTRTYSATAYPKYVFFDGDHLINYDKMPEFHCSSTLPVPAGKRDMTSHTNHELGHVWGLDHDSGDTTGVSVMFSCGVPGKALRSPQARDIARVTSLYGAK